jgi:undecaprenyl-diphosphatase
MTIYFALFLGFIQGATEFLPISSSGHLAIAQDFLGLKEAGLLFDVALHMGTLLAVLFYFRNDFILMANSLFRPKKIKEQNPDQWRMLFWYICVATIPGVISGLLIAGLAKTYLRHPGIIAISLSAAGLLLLLAEKYGKTKRNFETITFSDIIIIGLSQALAVIPGVSRSGITMTAGLFRGLDRPAVARFSFLLSAPIILGAGVYHIPEVYNNGLNTDQIINFTTGFLTSAVSGYLFIAFLLKFIQTRTFAFFAYYRFALSGLIWLLLLVR